VALKRLVTLCLLAGAAGLAGGPVSVIAQAPEEHAVKAPLATQSLLLDVARQGQALVAVGDRGHVLVSRDGGDSWVQADVPTRAMLTGVYMHDAKLGWAVGHDEVILRTRDGGTTWERVNYAPEHEKPLLDVWFEDANHGFAVGAYGGLLETRNAGDTWDTRIVYGEDDFHANQIAADADGRLFLAAEAGHLYRSEDRGATWQPLPSPYEGSFFGVLPLSDGSLLAFGLRGHLHRSLDHGTTWETIATGTLETLTSALELGPGRFVVGGMAGTVVWSQGGVVQTQALPDRRAIVALAKGTDGNVLAVGERGVRRIDIPR
jgi:photosystem II stability/assembly factor-like uncharacterized protein